MPAEVQRHRSYSLCPRRRLDHKIWLTGHADLVEDTILRSQSRPMTVSPDKVAELRVKHLEMVQVIIARIANYSATLKNYCITLTTAIAGFSLTLHRPMVALLGLLPVVMFCTLDAQFLRIERRLRRMFDLIRQGDWTVLPTFEINLRSAPPVSYASTLVSWSITIFFLPLAIVVAVITVIAHWTGSP